MGWAEQLAATDRAVAGQLGRPVTYAPAVGAPVSVTGIYDAAYLAADPGSPGVSTSSPAVFLQLADLPTDPEDDEPTITIPASGVAPAAGSFEVIEVKKDSNGAGVLLRLQAV